MLALFIYIFRTEINGKNNRDPNKFISKLEIAKAFDSLSKEKLKINPVIVVPTLAPKTITKAEDNEIMFARYNC